MHAGRHYTAREVFVWTLRETLIFVAIATLPTLCWMLLDCTWLSLPWQPVALVGTAVAFVTGFKNNAAYGRLWEARQIWGAIINESRTFAVQALDMARTDAETKKVLIYRHLAWLTALRFALREARSWETANNDPENKAYQRYYVVPEWKSDVSTELSPLLSESDAALVGSKKNRATHLLALQSRTLAALAEKGELSELCFIELERRVAALYDCQGRAERIKNFPYPRQFATLNTFFVWILVACMPFALLPELTKFGPSYAWLTIPISSLSSWVFHMIDKIGSVSENPFEGSPNDVPISAMCRTIEIDLRELLGEPPPAPLTPVNNILM